MLLALEDGFRLHRLIDPHGTPADSFLRAIGDLQRAIGIASAVTSVRTVKLARTEEPVPAARAYSISQLLRRGRVYGSLCSPDQRTPATYISTTLSKISS